MEMKRRQSRQMLLEEQFKIKALEIGRRHTVLDRRFSRRVSALPPISDAKLPRVKRARAKSIAMVSLPANEESYGTIINSRLPVKLPNIYSERKMSLQDNESHWNLPSRRVSRTSRQLILDHLRLNLLRQHEKRSLEYDAETKAVDAENKSDISMDSNDEETTKWLQTLRSHRTSLSTLNFHSPSVATPSKHENMFDNSMDSLRSFSLMSQSPSPSIESAMRQNQYMNFNESQRQPSSSFPFGHPSICVSFAPSTSYDGIIEQDGNDTTEQKETNKLNSISKKPSELHKSISESEKSVNLLIQMAKRRSGLFEIPESGREPRSPIDQQSLTSVPVSPLHFQMRSRSGRAKDLPIAPKDDVYSDLPIDKVSLFAEWRMQAESPDTQRYDSAYLEADNDKQTFYNGLSNRGSCYSPDSRPVTATLAPFCDDSGMETESVDDMTLDDVLNIDDVDSRQRKTYLQQILLGNATIRPSKLKRKVCLYLSSNGDDTDLERSALKDSLMSDFRQYCGKWNLDFSMIDLSFLSSKLNPSPNNYLPSWFKIDNKNSISKLRRIVIKHCFAESIGPVFMSFFGQSLDSEYPLPKRIPQFLFDGVINRIAAELKSIDQKIQITQISLLKCTSDESKATRVDRRNFAVRRTSISLSETPKNGEKLAKLQEEEAKLKEHDLLLSSWYLLNTNTQPCFYQLHPISCDFATFSASRRALSTDEEKMKDQEKWMVIEGRLRDILIKYTELKMWKNTEFESAVVEWRKQTFKSVVENETAFISTLPSWKIRETCFWFHRVIADLDLKSNQLQQFVSNNPRIQALHSTIKSKFGYSNMRERAVQWSAVEQAYTLRGANQRNREWMMYIDRLKTDFSSVCKTLIEKAVVKYQLQNEDDLEEEIYQHVAFAQAQSKHFVGREEILNDVKTYLRSKKQRQPFVIYGPCGCGKSSVVSHALVRSDSWMEKKSKKTRNADGYAENKVPNCRVIFRSIGLTGDSNNIRLFLASLCVQLQRIADAIEKENSDNEEKLSKFLSNFPKESLLIDLDFKKLVATFQILLKKCGRRRTPLFIFIDNLDAISADSEEKKYKWMPDKLPSFVKLIVTITGENLTSGVEAKERKNRPLSRTESLQHIKAVKSFSNRFTIAKTQSSECLAALKQRYRLDGTILSIPGLESSTKASLSALKVNSPHLQTIIFQMLQREKIHLSETQVSNIANSCRFYPHPLALVIGVAISKEWTSQTTSQKCFEDLPQRADSIESFVNCFFRNLESCHGRPFVAAVCSYVTMSLNGLTSNELLTLLSYDKNVSKWLTSLCIDYKQMNKNNQKTNVKKTVTGSKRSNLPKRTTTNSDKRAKRPEIYSKTTIPDLLWQRLKNDLAYFLIETLSDSKLTLRWRHVCFGSVSIKRYMSSNEVQSTYHQLMAHYFNNHIPTNTDETVEEDLCQPLFWKRKKETVPAENSLKFNQPQTKIENSITDVIIFNLRRLNESFYHYLSCRNLDEIKEDLLCNFEWLMAKMQSSGFQSVISAIASVLALHPGDKDLRLLAEALYLSRDVLTENPTQLGGQLVGRLHNIIKKDKPLARLDPRKYPFCRQLIGRCRRSLLPGLIPSGTCLSSPGDVLFDLLLGHRNVITAMTVTTDGQRAITASKDETIKVWDLFSGCVVSTLEKMPRHVISLAMCLGNTYVCVLDITNKIQVISLLKSTCLFSLTDLEGRIVIAVSGDSSCFLIVFFDKLKEMKIWDLNNVRLLHKIDISPDGCRLREDQHLITGKTAGGNNVFFSFYSTDQAYVYNVKRAKHLHTLKLQSDSGRATITHVETSLEYYVIACKRQYMRLHERVTFELYDSINFGHVRTLKACLEDKVFDICINRLGSHLIALCHIDKGTAIGAWSVESGFHQHLESEKLFSSQGYCVDLQYCITMCDETSTLRVHNLAARIDNKTLSRTHVKKKSSGIGEFYPVTSNSRYVVARGIDSGPITVWNITRGRCKGEAVSIERGLHEKNDVIVVKDVMVIVLSDRGISSVEEGSYQIFTTIYVYDLCLKKYTRKLNNVEITVCPRYEYRILDLDKLLGVSPDRSHFLIWSLIDGKVLHSITTDFSKYIVSEVAAKESTEKKWKRGRVVARKTLSLVALTNLAKKPRSAKFRLTASEQNKLIDQMLLSGDESTLLCSFFGRHVAVFDMKTLTHKHTLTNKHSMLLLHQAEITHSGSHLVHTNYDNDAKVSYITVWSLQHGKLVRRLRNEPYVCALTTSDKAEKVVFATDDNYLKIWEPYRRGGHCAIPGYSGLRMRERSNDCQGTTIYLTDSADRAVLFTYDISLWDLENACVLTRFSPDVPFQCWTVAMNGNLIVAGMREQENVVTLRLLSRDMDVTRYGRAALGENTGKFGETKEKDSESSEDEFFSE